MSSQKLAGMHPAWFAALMSTAGTSLAFLLDPFPERDFDEVVGISLLAVAGLAALLLLTAFAFRLWRHADLVRTDLSHPVFGPLTSALPAGVMVLSVAVAQSGVRGILDGVAPLAAALLALGLAGTLVLGFLIYLDVVNGAESGAAAMTGTWFIPVVPLVLVPNALIRLVGLEFIGHSEGVALLAVSIWGAGLFLFVVLAAAVGNRLLTLPPPPAAMAATWWIWLAPAGAGGLGALASADLLAGSELLETPAILWPIAMVLFGFGLWWLLFAGTLLWRQRAAMHFHLGTWGFGFPSAAFAALVLALGGRLEIAGLQALGSALVSLTLPLWLYLSWRTAQGIRSGKVFKRA